MAEIDSIVSVSIVATTAFPSAQGFGTPLLLGTHTRFAERYRVYSDLGGVAEDFETYDDMYRKARAIFSQNPTVTQLVIGRVDAGGTFSRTLTMLSATEGQVVALTVINPADGTVQPITYTIPAAATTTSVATAVATLIDTALGGVDVVVTPSGATIALTSTVGHVHVYDYNANVAVADTTSGSASTDYISALQEITLADVSWYTLSLDVSSTAIMGPMAAEIEAMKKLMFVNIHDTAELQTGTVGTSLKDGGFERTVSLWTANSTQMAADAWTGACLPSTPGSITWANKSLAGVTAVGLTATQLNVLRTANVNHYTPIATNINMTRDGVTAQGEFIDIVHGIDALSADIQLSVVSLLANYAKVPFTASGLDLVSATINGSLKRFEGSNEQPSLIAVGSSRVIMPSIESISPADKAARRLTNVRFTGTLAGAIHYVQINGTLTV